MLNQIPTRVTRRNSKTFTTSPGFNQGVKESGLEVKVKY